MHLTEGQKRRTREAARALERAERTEGLLLPPRFLPPWARDLRFLVSYLTYSAFLNRVDLARVKRHYDEMLRRTPVLDGWGRETY